MLLDKCTLTKKPCQAQLRSPDEYQPEKPHGGTIGSHRCRSASHSSTSSRGEASLSGTSWRGTAPGSQGEARQAASCLVGARQGKNRNNLFDMQNLQVPGDARNRCSTTGQLAGWEYPTTGCGGIHRLHTHGQGGGARGQQRTFPREVLEKRGFPNAVAADQTVLAAVDLLPIIWSLVSTLPEANPPHTHTHTHTKGEGDCVSRYHNTRTRVTLASSRMGRPARSIFTSTK